MTDQIVNTNLNGQSKMYFVLEQRVRDTIIQYIQSALSFAGILVSVANGLCEILANLQIIVVRHQKSTPTINKKFDEVSSENEDGIKT